MVLCGQNLEYAFGVTRARLEKVSWDHTSYDWSQEPLNGFRIFSKSNKELWKGIT